MWWTQMVLLTRAPACGRRSRVVLTPRRWCQVGGGNSACDGVNKPITGESTKETVKPLRGECRVISGVTVVTTLVCFVLFRTRGCGCIGHPAFPAPSEFQGGWFLQKLGRIAPRDRGRMLVVIARSEATKQSTLSLRGEMDCFASLAMKREARRDRAAVFCRHCEERSDEAIHSFFTWRDALLRFARNEARG